jgi:hypothetical protein
LGQPGVPEGVVGCLDFLLAHPAAEDRQTARTCDATEPVTREHDGDGTDHVRIGD